LRNYFLSCGNRSIELLDLMVAQPQDSPSRPRTAIPLLVYHRIIGLICWTLVSFVFFWIALTIVSVYLVPL
jgi:Fe2+ transport system protein B